MSITRKTVSSLTGNHSVFFARDGNQPPSNARGPKTRYKAQRGSVGEAVDVAGRAHFNLTRDVGCMKSSAILLWA